MESSEFRTRDELREKRKEVKTFDELVEFLRDVKDNYNIGYGDAPRAIAQAAVGVAWFLSGEFGITGFQSGATLWDFIRDWSYPENKTGLRLINYDNMLYPQYGDMFEKTISEDTWKLIVEEAKNKLEKYSKNSHPNVVAHWRSIANGILPFGYTIKDA